jgi:hypothetical protein
MANVTQLQVRNFSGQNVRVHSIYTIDGILAVDIVSEDEASARVEAGYEGVAELPQGGQVHINLVEKSEEDSEDAEEVTEAVQEETTDAE